MIRARPLSIGCVVVAAAVGVELSVFLAAMAGMAANHNPALPVWWPVLWGLLPVFVTVGTVVALSTRRDRLVVTGVGIAVLMIGYALVPVWVALSLQGVELVNETAQPLEVYWAREGEQLRRVGPPLLEPGASYKSRAELEKKGQELRIVALRTDGKRIFDRTYGWSEFQEMGGRVVFTSLEPLP